MKWFLFALLMLTANLSLANSKLSNQIYLTTLDAPKNLIATKVESGNRIYELYGTEINDESTAYGRLACARVASILLRKAGVDTKILDRVAQIEKLVSDWKKINSPIDLLPGDVIIWKARGNGDVCKGGGDCHVGIIIDDGQAYQNDWNLGYPVAAPINSIPGFTFKMGYRP